MPKYEVTVKMGLRSRHTAERIVREMENAFEFETLREAIAEGLWLLHDPHLIGVSVRDLPLQRTSRTGRLPDGLRAGPWIGRSQQVWSSFG